MTVQDEELNDSVVMALMLERVNLELRQRPAASNFLLTINMEQLTVCCCDEYYYLPGEHYKPFGEADFIGDDSPNDTNIIQKVLP